MDWVKHLRLVAICFIALALGGCASTIKTYDSTFTYPTTTLSKGSFAVPRRSSTIGETKSLASDPRLYFIEFRARNALSYGHAAVVFGKLDDDGNVPVDEEGVLIPGMVEISGLHPATPSSLPWTVGHVVPVPAETGPSDGDFEDKYVTARFRVNLTAAEFRKVVIIVYQHKELGKLWYAPVFSLNCLGYIGSIARKLNLKVPQELLLPKDFVEKLRILNT